jgi:Gpi16 subunit, GPI transamidase component
MRSEAFECATRWWRWWRCQEAPRIATDGNRDEPVQHRLVFYCLLDVSWHKLVGLRAAMHFTFRSIFRSALFFLYTATVCFWTAGASEYSERLLLRPLPENAVLASFNFRSNGSSSSFDHQNFRYFPRSFGQILQHAHTKELHIRFSLGRWDAETWGERPWHGAREGGTGVELWAWVEAKSDEEYEATYRTGEFRLTPIAGRMLDG